MRWEQQHRFRRLFNDNFLRCYYSLLALLFVFLVPFLFNPESSSIDCITHDASPLDGITFISTPIHQPCPEVLALYKTAITSWLMADPRSRVLLFADDQRFNWSGVLAFSERVTFVSAFRADLDGIPFARHFFTAGAHLARTLYCCFIRMDVVVDTFWYERVMSVASVCHRRDFFVTGDSVTAELIQNTFQFSEHADFYKALRETVRVAKCAADRRGDWFVWPTHPQPFSLAQMPEFVLGGRFLADYIIQVADDHTQAVTMGIKAAVYRIVTLDPYLIGETSRTYQNARIVAGLSDEFSEKTKLPVAFDGKGLVGELSFKLPRSPYVPFIDMCI
jgi:hypothetical protein